MFVDIKSQMEEAANYARHVEAKRIDRLRDEFAMAALAGLIEPWERARNKPEDISERAYKYADAMMEARK